MKTEKILIQLLDGATSWVTIDAKRIADNQYEILSDKEYTEYIDPLYLHEFYPGDIVELGNQTFSDGTAGKVAKELIQEGQWIDRKFKEFKFKATLGQLTIDKPTADKYNAEIERVRKENNDGQFFYPTLMSALEELNILKEN